MWFRTGPANRFTRLVAALLLMSFGVWLLFPLPPLGFALAGFGLGLAVWQGIGMARERRGKYDLARLREIHERERNRDEPEEDRCERELAYCHRCNLSVPENYSICPECGGHLGKGGC